MSGRARVAQLDSRATGGRCRRIAQHDQGLRVSSSRATPGHGSSTRGRPGERRCPVAFRGKHRARRLSQKNDDTVRLRLTNSRQKGRLRQDQAASVSAEIGGLCGPQLHGPSIPPARRAAATVQSRGAFARPIQLSGPGQDCVDPHYESMEFGHVVL